MKPPLKRADSLAWMDSAACLRPDVEPEIFFPVSPSSPATDAKDVCATCPVRKACDDYARTHGMEFGVWGGTTEDERRLERDPASSGPKCGEYAGVSRHRRRKEALCRPCADAANEFKRNFRARKRKEALA